MGKRNAVTFEMRIIAQRRIAAIPVLLGVLSPEVRTR